MKIRSFRIPKQVVLPGLVVQVHQVPPKNQILDECSGAWIYDEKGTAVILLNKCKSLAIRRYTLLHELQHVMTDYLDQAIERYPRSFQTKQMARAAKAKR
jgi:Zn-dependent peptidase ImmA (M78 family)